MGNVIIDLDIERTWLSLAHHLPPDYKTRIAAAYPQGDLFDDFETGDVSPDFFFDTLRAVADTPLSIKQLAEAWNAMLLRIPMPRLEMLALLKDHYQVFLLSNTNATHLDWVDGYLRTVHGFDLAHFDAHFFHKAYYSHLVRLRKPHPTIYEYVLADAQLRPEETLFIDDNADNIKGAQAVGIQTYHHPIGVEIIDVLREKGIFKP